jgi:hypothetical protein
MTEAESQTLGYTCVCDQRADPIKAEDRFVGEVCVVLGGVMRSGSGSCVLGLGNMRSLRNRACRIARYAIGICLVRSEKTVVS